MVDNNKKVAKVGGGRTGTTVWGSGGGVGGLGGGGGGGDFRKHVPRFKLHYMYVSSIRKMKRLIIG